MLKVSNRPIYNAKASVPASRAAATAKFWEKSSSTVVTREASGWRHQFRGESKQAAKAFSQSIESLQQ